MAKTAYFDPSLFQFLTDLKTHNDRDWFQANKPRYEEQVRDPFLRLIADLHPAIEKINPRIVVDPSPNRGSMMRIYRDIRFSSDKSPYKTHVSAHFPHARAKDDAMPGYYIHLAPGSCMLGAGVWRPEPRAAQKIRSAIVANPKRWKQATGGKHFGSACSMIGESLKRPPAGIDPNHPFIEDLKRKDFAVSAPLTDDQVCSPALLKLITDNFRATAPLMQFLSDAVGLK
ncbi:MAG TPA: DUF2461 domain-containing protein [Bryobacteraceae bacterium]|jgi:uncharacterized protein (TIGR02453 family)